MKKYLAIALISLLQACVVGPQYNVHVDSISSPAAALKTKYFLLPGLKGVDASDLQYREYSVYVERALALRGFTKASTIQEANVVILLGYGIGDPETREYTYSLPTYGQTGIASANTYGTINSYGNTATYSGTTTYTPTYGITGSTTYTGTSTTFYRFMWLDALDLDEFRKSEKQVPLWKTTVSSTGYSGDLRLVFPILVAASKPHIGSNTGQKMLIILHGGDKRVDEIKGFSSQ